MKDHETQDPESGVGRLLREVRTIRQLSQEQLAGHMLLAGFSAWRQSTVAKTEAGERPLRVNEFVALCLALEVEAPRVLAEVLPDGAEIDAQQRLLAAQAKQRHITEALEVAAAEKDRLEAALVEARQAVEAMVAVHETARSQSVGN